MTRSLGLELHTNQHRISATPIAQGNFRAVFLKPLVSGDALDVTPAGVGLNQGPLGHLEPLAHRREFTRAFARLKAENYLDRLVALQ